MSASLTMPITHPPEPAILDELPIGVLRFDEHGRLNAPANRAAARLLRGEPPFGRTLIELLKPLVAEKTLQGFAASLGAAPRALSGEGPALVHTIELRAIEHDPGATTAHLRIELRPLADPKGQALALICDWSHETQLQRELEDLRRESAAQAEILRGVLRLGRARFASSVQKSDAALAQIDQILKKPAREQASFRRKLEETLDQVDRIRREGAALRLGSLEAAARSFEDALHELRGRATLSGSDFLPLALKLDDLYGRFAALRTATKNALPARKAAPVPVTENGTRIIDAPQFIRQARALAAAEADARAAGEPAADAPRLAPSGATPQASVAAHHVSPGSLESTLEALTRHIAEEHRKRASLECSGLGQVPAGYQATVKNVAIQLIRNAIMHGIESAGRRLRNGKAPDALLRLSFQAIPAGGYEMRFQDDGRGIDPKLVRRVAAARGLLSAEQLESMTDRQVIKLIFKSAFSTLTDEPGGPAHGTGLSLVRRYVEETGGTIALASETGQSTRYKISLPRIDGA
ncbi:MAG: hypothetical protein KGL34_06095 [Gammaproteobacteria bacterium]|nr:hypothetical protein [Gammaproteobacteria bacterium]